MKREAFLVASSLLPFASIQVARSAPLDAIRVAGQPGNEVTPVLYAQQTGMFAKAGLDVSVDRMPSGASIAAAVAGGSIDIGKSSLVTLIEAHTHGVPFALLVPGLLWVTNSPTAGLIALKSAGPLSGADLDGKTLSTSALKDLGEIGMRSWIDAHGGDSRTAHFLEVPTGAVVAALESGRIIAGNLPDPLLSDALASGRVQVIGRPDDAIAKRFLTTAWFANLDYIARSGPAIQRFERVVEQATRYTNDHPTETAPLMAGFSAIPTDVVLRMNRGTVGLRLDPRDIQPLIDAAAKYGVIGRSFLASELISSAALSAG